LDPLISFVGLDGIATPSTACADNNGARRPSCSRNGEASANTAPPSQSHEIFVGEEEISDVSLTTFYIFDKENAGPPSLSPKPRLAVGGGAGCVCAASCASAVNAAHTASKEEASARTKWRSASPPQLSFAQ
jgi:hypothetical protein